MTTFPQSAAAVPDLIELASTPSTNSELVRRAAEAPALPSFSTVVTTDQTAGRGRLDRHWVAPAGSALAISVLVRVPPRIPEQRLGWLPIAAGVAMVVAVRDVIPATSAVGVKWPNDVLIEGRKVSGILSELLADGSVVIGAGLNVGMTTEQLPVPTATSLAIAGAAVAGDTIAGDTAAIDRLLAAYLRGLRLHVENLWAAGANADLSGLRAQATAQCVTLGTDVRVELPAGGELRGTAIALDADGRLVVRTADGSLQHVAAGDVTHLR